MAEALQPHTCLFDRGYCVLPASPTFSPQAMIDEFHATMDAFPEFEPGLARDAPRVMGGFSALGNPASFHNPLVRRLRREVHAQCLPVFQAYGAAHCPQLPYLVMAMDRMLFRPAGVVPTAEKWHRDVSPHKHALNFGGWINLGDHPQYLSCIPGSHYTHPTPILTAGFVSECLGSDADKCRVLIAPGEVLLFNSTLVHEVVADRVDHNIYRLFINFRLQPRLCPPLETDALLELVHCQGVPRLPSGQPVPMYAALHWVNWRDKLTAFSQCIRAELREFRELPPPRVRRRRHCSPCCHAEELPARYPPLIKAIDKKGRIKKRRPHSHQQEEAAAVVDTATPAVKPRSFHIVPRFMKSLADMGLPLYAPYSTDEFQTLTACQLNRCNLMTDAT